MSLIKPVFLCLVAFVLGLPTLYAQQQPNIPRIGYVFPAGAQRGTTCEILIGGQFIGNTKDLLVSGSGIKVSTFTYHKPLPMKRANELRDYLMEARKKLTDAKDRSPAGVAAMKGLDLPEIIGKILKEAGATDEEIRGFLEIRQQRNDPKRQPNAQISESITVKMEIAPDAQTGPRELRLLSPTGATNPLSFCIGRLPEPQASGTLGKSVDTAARVALPAVLNGQILPGGIDHYSFEAKRGARVVIAVQARDLIPYLADAVPGWFQPIVVVYDAKGKEVAYGDDYRFSPDPVVCYDVPENGVYVLEIKDALYRGREDFVYRITVGELPFVTTIFPLGGKVGTPETVDVWGWNLPRKRAVIPPTNEEGIHPVPELSNGFIIGDVAFASDTLPEISEKEPNNGMKEAQSVKLPVIINGRIDAPGDVDVFAITCKAGAKVVAEVVARRLNSPVDSWLKVTDETGLQIAFNDDRDDKGAGLLTHHADSYLTFTAPSSGQYFVFIGDSQKKGGPDYGYRLRISAPQSDFALRLVPSSLNGRPGGVVPVKLYALRKDGFSGDINLTLKDAPAGFAIQGGVIPAGQDSVRATLMLPPRLDDAPLRLSMEGHASAGGREITRPVVPADDMLQAFIYHHLVPANELLVMKSNGGRNSGTMGNVKLEPVKLRVNGEGRLIIPPPAKGGMSVGPEMRLELSEPPDGITLESMTPTAEGTTLVIKTDAKVKAGLRGNLILEVFNERMQQAPGGKKAEKRRYPAGFLPAVPFEVRSGNNLSPTPVDRDQHD